MIPTRADPAVRCAAFDTARRNGRRRSTTSPATVSKGATRVTNSHPRSRIANVVLFSSGVGYFQREGFVEGNQRIDLSFPVNDINDLIKSMTLRDLDGGHINAVSYDSNVPVERTLQSFAVNLAAWSKMSLASEVAKRNRLRHQ